MIRDAGQLIRSSHFQELELKRQRLQAQAEACRKTIVDAVNSVFEMENVLDRTARLYGGALKERQQLINQWTQSVLVMKQRDNEIHKTLRVRAAKNHVKMSL